MEGPQKTLLPAKNIIIFLVDPIIASQSITRMVMAVTETKIQRKLTMNKKMSKEDWVALFKKIGLSSEQMKQWHHLFETQHPESHQEFLAWLGISPAEIVQIRSNSK